MTLCFLVLTVSCFCYLFLSSLSCLVVVRTRVASVGSRNAESLPFDHDGEEEEEENGVEDEYQDNDEWLPFSSCSASFSSFVSSSSSLASFASPSYHPQ